MKACGFRRELRRVHLATAGLADDPEGDTTSPQEGFDASFGVHGADCATVGGLRAPHWENRMDFFLARFAARRFERAAAVLRNARCMPSTGENGFSLGA